MLELQERCPAPAPASAPSPSRSKPSADSPTPSLRESSPWSDRAASWLRSASDTLTRSIIGEPVVDRFAELAAAALEPEEVRVELVRLVWKVSGARRVELFSEKEAGIARRLTSWPPIIPLETLAEGRSNPRGPIVGTTMQRIKEHPTPLTLDIPLKAGGSSFGTIRLTATARKPWPARVVRRLSTLCSIASAAERGLARPARSIGEPSLDSSQEPHGSTILAAFLCFAQAQARRRHEPLSLLEVALDRLDPIRELLGEALAEAALERVSRAIKATIRASDVVTRLEDGRISVLLPNASAENARIVAENIRTAITRAGSASTTMPLLTASIGIATYPDHAHDVTTLRAAAASTLTLAREQGHEQILTALPTPIIAATTLAHRVG